MSNKKSFFGYGELAAIAKQCGLSRSRLCDVFHRRRNVNINTAKKIAVATILVTGKTLPWQELMNTKYSNHPAFFGKAIKWVG